MIQYPKNYIVWDLETSGLNPGEDDVLEIGYAVIVDGKVSHTSSMLLDHGIEISETTTKLTGITKQKIDIDGTFPEKALKDLVNAIGNLPHITHNGLKFDIPFLIAALHKTSIDIPDIESFHKKLLKNMIDTAVLFKAKKAGRMRRFNETFEEFGNRVMEERIYGLKYNVKVCCEELGIELTEQHRALSDVLLTNQIYQKLCLQPL